METFVTEIAHILERPDLRLNLISTCLTYRKSLVDVSLLNLIGMLFVLPLFVVSYSMCAGSNVYIGQSCYHSTTRNQCVCHHMMMEGPIRTHPIG